MKKAFLASLLLLGSLSATVWAQDDFYDDQPTDEVSGESSTSTDGTVIPEGGSEEDYEDYETNFED